MPSAAFRERAGYPQPYSRNDLIASRQYADLATMTEVARSSIDGVIVSDGTTIRTLERPT